MTTDAGNQASTEYVGPPEMAVTRIGRSGKKLHPIIRLNGHWMALCGCAGTASGWWQQHASIYRSVQPTCGRVSA